MIDAHHHLWHYDPAAYAWIDDQMQVLQRDYLPADLDATLAPAGVTAAVAVQARQTIEETDWLLACRAQTPRIAGVVGWLPLVSPAIGDMLAQYRPGLVGLRHILQGEPDPDYCLRADFDAGLARLEALGLVYDILIYPQHLPQATAMVDRHPHQRFVLDHMAKPRIRAGAFDQAWADDLRALARREQVVCKLSGLVTEVRDPQWDPALLRPYLDTALEAFGPARLMFGSDWPVCLLRSSYDTWLATLQDYLSALSDSEQAQIFRHTAQAVYRI
ncbi:MAG: amidohydrolase family protein [Bacteroidia bacterium]